MSLYVDISKRLGDFCLNVSFQMDDGVLGLLGTSGCGKSYTLKCIAGIERPDRGKIVLDEMTLFDSKERINLPPQKRKVGYLFQNYALFPNMTVRQNILCGLYHEKDRQKRERALRQALNTLQLEKLEHHRPGQLSGGQAQRVALARILVSQPKLLMLDEPFSALDSHLREKLQMDMRELMKQFGKDVILVTHSRDEAYRLCSRIAVMDNGSILTVKPTKTLFHDPGSIHAALLTGCKNIASARRTGPHEVEVPEWGIRLTTAQPVPENVAAIGIRGHSFSSQEETNRFPIQIVNRMEEPFEWVVEFRYPNQPINVPSVWWRIAKAGNPDLNPSELGVEAEQVLLLNQ